MDGPTCWLDASTRGFTGHEMLDALGLINMNGRVYDPLIGRFLSADPIIQTIQLSQALNPYSYVMNNPLALIDPSGYSWLSKLFSSIGKFLKKFWKPLLAIVVAFALPFASSWFTTFWGTVTSGAICGYIATGSLQGALIGAVTAGLLYGAGKVAGQIRRSMRTLQDSRPVDWDTVFAANGLNPEMANALSGGTGSMLETVTVMGKPGFWDSLVADVWNKASAAIGGAVAGAAQSAHGVIKDWFTVSVQGDYAAGAGYGKTVEANYSDLSERGQLGVSDDFVAGEGVQASAQVNVDVWRIPPHVQSAPAQFSSCVFSGAGGCLTLQFGAGQLLTIRLSIGYGFGGGAFLRGWGGAVSRQSYLQVF